MAVSAGDAYLDVHARLAGDTGRKLTGQLQGPMGRAGEDAGRHFGKKFAVGLAIGAAAIGVGLLRATQAAARGIQATTDKASDLNETINKTNVIFGKNAAEIQKWSRGSARNLGLSRQEALSSAAAFGDMFLQLKLGQPQAVRMSKGMVTLASDLASFSNADITQVLEAQQSAFRGEYDALQRFIPNINAARVEQEALAETHKKSAKELTAAEKAQAVYTIMLKDSARAQGDFQRTSRQLANTRRIEKAQWEDLQAAIGKRFLPAQLAVHRALSEKVLPALGVLVRTYGPAVERTATRWATSFANVIPSTRDLQLGLRALGLAFAGEGITTSSDKFVGKMERVGVAARRVIDWFKQMRPAFGQTTAAAVQLGPALAEVGGGGRLFANTLSIIAPVLDVVGRNMHNIIPFLPVLVAGFLAFRGVRSAIAPVREIGQAIANFASPAIALATFANARASRALAEAYREQAVAATAAAGANERLTATNAGTGASAGGAASKLGLLGAASVAVGSALFTGADAVRAFKQGTLDARDPVTLLVDKVFGLKLGLVNTGEAQRDNTAATRTAISVADRHAAAVRGEHDAVSALKDALRGEESAELDVRQAKLNVSSAQRRLTGLVDSGRRGSAEYRQAQIDLKRAQLDLKQRTDEYKVAQQRATAATGGAMHATQRAQGPYKKFGETAQTAGRRAFVMGQNARNGIGLIHSKSVTVRATFGFNTPPGVSVHDIVGATGGRVTARAIIPMRRARGGPVWGAGTTTSDDIPAYLSNNEHVWDAAAVKGAGGGSYKRGHERLAGMRREARGYATGGPVLDAEFPSGNIMVRAALRFEGAINRIIGRLASKWDRFAGVQPPHAPGGWKVATQFLASLGIPYNIVSTFRPGAVTHASGRQSYHALNRAVDLTGPNMLRIWSALTRTNPTELIYSRAPYYISRRGRRPIGALDPITRADHYSHVHAAYDRGGWLMPGTTVAHNRTGRPELVMPLGKLSEVFRVNLRSWVVPWLKRIAVGVEGAGGGGGRAGGGGGGVAKRAAPWWAKYGASVDYGTVSQRTWDALYAAGWRGRPGDRAERFYRPASFDQGGWLQPGMVGVNTGTKAERVVGPHEQLIDERGLARMVGRAVAQSLRDNPPAVYLDRQKVSRGVADGALWERRR